MRRVLPDGFELDDDRDRVDVDVVYRYLSEEAYWVPGRSRATIEEQIRSSTRVIAAYELDRALVGFCRVISDGASMAWLRWQGVRAHLVGSLSHAVSLEHRNLKQALHLFHNLGRKGRATGAHKPQVLGTGGLLRIAHSGQHKLVNGGDRRIPGDAMLTHHPPERQRVELGRHNHCST